MPGVYRALTQCGTPTLASPVWASSPWGQDPPRRGGWLRSLGAVPSAYAGKCPEPTGTRCTLLLLLPLHLSAALVGYLVLPGFCTLACTLVKDAKFCADCMCADSLGCCVLKRASSALQPRMSPWWHPAKTWARVASVTLYGAASLTQQCELEQPP